MSLATCLLALAILPAQKLPPVKIAPVPVPAPAPMVIFLGKAIQVQPAAVPTPTSLLSSTGGNPEVLRAAGIGVDSADLLAFFRLRTPPAPTRERLAELIKQLGARELAVRERAQGQLAAIGQPAIPLVREAANNPDNPEAYERARLCLKHLDVETGAQLVSHAARLLAVQKPAGAAEVLLGYLPYAENDTVFQDIESALATVALREGKPDPALVKALEDPLALRRGAAASVLCQVGGSAQHAALRPLLRDPQSSVRLRVALGLVDSYDAEAVPVLIELLSEGTPKLREQAEEHLMALAGEWAVSGPRGSDGLSRRLRREVWAAWWKSTDGKELIEEFRSRSLPDAEREQVQALIKKLGSPVSEIREGASSDLVSLGKKTASLLRAAVAGNDPSISPAAARVLETIEKEVTPILPAAAPRLLALRRPEGTIDALVRYVPFCESPESREQIIEILVAVGCPDGKPDAALLKGLEDTAPSRRATVALVLGRGRATSVIPALRKLLRDDDLDVRLRSAQALARLGERNAVPALIALLDTLPIDQVGEVEEMLAGLAGDTTPLEVVTADPASRKKAMDAWDRWWQTHGKTADLARLEGGRKEQGNYLVLENYNQAFGRGRVLEVDSTGKVRWEVRGLMFPTDVQLLRNGNLLVVEQHQRFLEYDRAGKVVAPARFYPNIFLAERLRDGSTFVACRHQLLLVDAKWNTTFTHNTFGNNILAARRSRDGSIAYVCSNGLYVRLDPTGKEAKKLQLNWTGRSANFAEVLPGDQVLLSDHGRHLVTAWDGDGKMLWETSINSPQIPSKLASGHLLVPGSNQTVLYELDRRGKIVKEWKNLPFRPYRAEKR